MGRRYVRHRLYMVRPVQAGSVKPRRPVSTPGRTHISENLPASRKDKEYGIDSYTKNKMQLPYKLDAKSSDAALREARMCAMTFYPRFSETEKPDVEVVKR